MRLAHVRERHAPAGTAWRLAAAAFSALLAALFAGATISRTDIWGLDWIAAFLPGAVLLFRMREGAVAKHLGIVSSLAAPAFIHAYTGHGVIESALAAPWRRKIVARFSFPARFSISE